jgi:hypothetical protein
MRECTVGGSACTELAGWAGLETTKARTPFQKRDKGFELIGLVGMRGIGNGGDADHTPEALDALLSQWHEEVLKGTAWLWVSLRGIEGERKWERWES